MGEKKILPDEKVLRYIQRERRRLIIRGVVYFVRFLFETAVIVAVIWLVYKQCQGA